MLPTRSDSLRAAEIQLLLHPRALPPPGHSNRHPRCPSSSVRRHRRISTGQIRRESIHIALLHPRALTLLTRRLTVLRPHHRCLFLATASPSSCVTHPRCRAIRDSKISDLFVLAVNDEIERGSVNGGKRRYPTCNPLRLLVTLNLSLSCYFSFIVCECKWVWEDPTEEGDAWVRVWVRFASFGPVIPYKAH